MLRAAIKPTVILAYQSLIDYLAIAAAAFAAAIIS